MLWAKKLDEVQKAIARDLGAFLNGRMPGVNGKAAAEDLARTAIKLDMSRSATRLRRRLYAAWGAYDLVEGEFLMLTHNGVEERPISEPDPAEIGDMHVDPFRIASVVKMLGGLQSKTRLSHADRIKATHVVLTAIIARTRSTRPPLTEQAVAVLMALHTVEADRRVEKGNVSSAVKRLFGQWGLPVPSEPEIHAALDVLVTHGFLKDTGDGVMWRVNERVSYPW